MKVINRIGAVGLLFVALLSVFLPTTAAPAAAASHQPEASAVRTAAAAQAGCTNVAYDPYIDYRPVAGVVTKVVVGHVRIECAATVQSINVRVNILKIGGTNSTWSTACGSQVTYCDVEHWVRYSSGTWRTAGQALIAAPQNSYSANVQL